MRYLVLLPRIVFPADTGAKIRNLNMFSRLSERGDEATVVCYRHPDDSDTDVERMRARCTHLELVPWNEVVTFSARSYVAALSNLVSPYPYAVEKYTTPAYSRRVARLLAQESFDGIVADTAYLTLPVLEHAKGLPSICFQHNVEYVIRQRQYEKQSNPLLKAFLYYDYWRLRRHEQRIGQRFDHLIMVSENDRETMAGLGVHNTSSVPLGVDVEFFKPTDPDPSLASHDLVFTGSMDWLPNVDGMTWFIKEVLPKIRARVHARVWIVGRSPGRDLQHLAESTSDVLLTGRVRDIRSYIAESAVYIVPLRIGGGTRIKIFEAMAMGKAVVSTTIGAEGLPVTHGADVVLADDAERFAAEVLRLLESPAERSRLGGAARKLVVENYSWSKAADVFADICRGVVERRQAEQRTRNKG